MSYDPTDDRPSPSEQPLRARVPDHVAGGAFSTGVIVMTAHTEFILDFVQNLGRPHQIVARVVMPHNVLPQLVDALQRNIDIYRSRWGDLPGQGSSPSPTPPRSADLGASVYDTNSPPAETSQQPAADNPDNSAAGSAGPNPGPQGATGGNLGGSNAPVTENPTTDAGPSGVAPTAAGDAGGSQDQPIDAGSATEQGNTTQYQDHGARQASAQEIYDDLKIKDELLSGSYANAVMIGHGAHEFSFDFITNFYPNSAVSARVFLAAGQVVRLYDSLKGTWDQIRRGRPAGPPPGDASGQNPSGGSDPTAPGSSGPDAAN